jgi:hypothetical protein
MSVYLGYDTITKQYLKDLISNKEPVVTEWLNYYVNVSTTYTWPNGYPNFQCSVRSNAITENTSLGIKMFTFDDIDLASLSGLTLDVRARFVRLDKTVLTQDLISVDLSSKFSFSMKKGETGSVSCVRVHEKVNVGDAKGASLFQIGVKFKSVMGAGVRPELAVIYAIG